ncbi:hypothetical protein J3E72DRAFT_199846 [Bipolaris maydis]|nr:hypothetical protein J3E72DRAFT_199846 [Bipolaris maydis]
MDLTTPPATPSSSIPNSPTKSDPATSNPNTKNYTTAFPTLPPATPQTHAHILNLLSPPAHPTLQDTLVTTLYHASPSTLSRFLDPTVHTFKQVLGKGDIKLVIWRKGVEVFIGMFENHTQLKVFRFPWLAGLLVGYDGCWRVTCVAANAYAATRWSDVWVGKFECRGGVEKMRVWSGDEEGVEMGVREMGGKVLGGRFWEGMMRK